MSKSTEIKWDLPGHAIEAASFAAIAAEFMDFVSDAELIIHNASFDMGFLRHELKLLKQQKLSCPRAHRLSKQTTNLKILNKGI